jgi:DNA-binding LytR/AlgR family response regulator
MLAFLDIRMPGLSGLEVARAFSHRTHVVFITAYQEHALAAFDEGALDYALKPTDPARLARAVGRLRGMATRLPVSQRFQGSFKGM